jgi:STE24 endopeptidase
MILTQFFLALVMAYTVARLYLTLRHSRHIARNRSAVPAAFSQQITLEQHQKAADYAQAKIKFGLIALALELVVLMAWTLGGGLTVLTQLLSTLGVKLNTVWGGVALFSAFGAIGSVIDLPLSWAAQFKLEQAFGFNRSTQKTFWLDLIKGLLLGAVMGLPLLAAMLWMMQTLGQTWWMWAGSLLIGFNLLMLWIYPTWIAPLFNTFTPLTDAALKARIEALAQRCGFGLSNILVMDGSKRSGHGNAYFTGFGKNKRIVFFDTLLTQLTPEETEAVLAHELGHYHHKHVVKRMLWMFASLFALLAVVGYLMQQPAFFQALGAPFQLNGGNEAMALILFSMISGYVLFFFSPLSNQLSRKHEFEADAFAASRASGAALQTALVNMYRDNASTLTPDPLHSLVFDTHPPAPVRISALQNIATKTMKLNNNDNNNDNNITTESVSLKVTL